MLIGNYLIKTKILIKIMKRLFIAIRLPHDESFLTALSDLRSVSNKLDKINWIRPDNLHITLKFLGETKPELIPSIENKIVGLISGISPFTITLNRIGAFGSRYQPRIIWIGSKDTIKEIDYLHKGLEKQMQTLGYKHSFGNFVPHATIARIHNINDKKFFWKQIESHTHLFNFNFQVKEIILFESILHNLYSPEYKIIKKFELNNE